MDCFNLYFFKKKIFLPTVWYSKSWTVARENKVDHPKYSLQKSIELLPWTTQYSYESKEDTHVVSPDTSKYSRFSDRCRRNSSSLGLDGIDKVENWEFCHQEKSGNYSTAVVASIPSQFPAFATEKCIPLQYPEIPPPDYDECVNLQAHAEMFPTGYDNNSENGHIYNASQSSNNEVITDKGSPVRGNLSSVFEKIQNTKVPSSYFSEKMCNDQTDPTFKQQSRSHEIPHLLMDHDRRFSTSEIQESDDEHLFSREHLQGNGEQKIWEALVAESKEISGISNNGARPKDFKTHERMSVSSSPSLLSETAVEFRNGPFSSDVCNTSETAVGELKSKSSNEKDLKMFISR